MNVVGGICKYQVGRVTFFRSPTPLTDEALNHITEHRGDAQATSQKTWVLVPTLLVKE